MTFMIIFTGRFGLSLHILPHLIRLKLGWVMLVGTSTDVDHTLFVQENELQASREVLCNILARPAVMRDVRPLGVLTAEHFTLPWSQGYLDIPLDLENGETPHGKK